jgi:signal transduction histidine kinase
VFEWRLIHLWGDDRRVCAGYRCIVQTLAAAALTVRLRAVLSWLDHHRSVTDGTAAVFIVLLSLPDVLKLRVGDRQIVALLTCFAFLPLAFVRRFPVWVALVTGVSALLLVRFGLTNQVGVIWATYQVGRRHNEQVLRTMVVGLCTAYAPFVFALPALATTPWPRRIGEAAVIFVPIVLFPVALGRVMAARNERIAFLQAQLTLQRLAAESATNEAVAHERLAIARDLHDSLAHQLTVISYQAAGLSATALRGLADPRSSAAVISASNAIEDAARHSLMDLKAVVGPLRRSDNRELHPIGIAYVSELIDQSAGESFKFIGELEEVPSSVGIVMYRVTQESLTNARRHAPGNPVTVRLRVAADKVELEIVNTMSCATEITSGFGVLGMTERVLSIGGRMTVGMVGSL